MSSLAFLCTEMEDLTARICWELVKKEAYIAIWQKPLNNSCYLNRDSGVQPPVCDSNDDPDNVWYDLLHSFEFTLVEGHNIQYMNFQMSIRISYKIVQICSSVHDL